MRLGQLGCPSSLFFSFFDCTAEINKKKSTSHCQNESPMSLQALTVSFVGSHVTLTCLMGLASTGAWKGEGSAEE